MNHREDQKIHNIIIYNLMHQTYKEHNFKLFSTQCTQASKTFIHSLFNSIHTTKQNFYSLTLQCVKHIVSRHVHRMNILLLIITWSLHLILLRFHLASTFKSHLGRSQQHSRTHRHSYFNAHRLE